MITEYNDDATVGEFIEAVKLKYAEIEEETKAGLKDLHAIFSLNVDDRNDEIQRTIQIDETLHNAKQKLSLSITPRNDRRRSRSQSLGDAL